MKDSDQPSRPNTSYKNNGQWKESWIELIKLSKIVFKCLAKIESKNHLKSMSKPQHTCYQKFYNHLLVDRVETKFDITKK